MSLPHVLGKELDPISDVRREFERHYYAAYFTPGDGDWMSDDYWGIIDLATQPNPLTERDQGRLNRRILRLNEQYDRIVRILGTSLLVGAHNSAAESFPGPEGETGLVPETALVDAYNSVAEQVNSINAADPNRINIVHMRSSVELDTVVV